MVALQVVLEWHPYGLVAIQDDLLVHAFGDDRTDVLEALAERLRDQYQDLVGRSEADLAPRLLPVRGLLQSVLIRLSA
jgi:hypothetical protein